MSFYDVLYISMAFSLCEPRHTTHGQLQTINISVITIHNYSSFELILKKSKNAKCPTFTKLISGSGDSAESGWSLSRIASPIGLLFHYAACVTDARKSILLNQVLTVRFRCFLIAGVLLSDGNENIHRNMTRGSRRRM